MSVFEDDNADVFAASLSISNCSFSSLNLPSISMTIFYIVSGRFFLRRKVLSDARIIPITKKENSLTVHFL